MQVAFSKINGAGNDFIIIDNREGKVELSSNLVERLCHRQNGIGADGIIMQENNSSDKADWKWTFYNSDGSSAEMCGNGARCFARFVKENGSEDRDEFTIETIAGIIKAHVHGEEITVGLTEPIDPEFDFELALENDKYAMDFINTGVPHAVHFTEEELSADKIVALGRRIRFHSHFAPNGTNVNFATRVSDGHISLHTYERGVEAETLACGTGVSASALIAARKFGWDSPVKVDVKNGDTLEVSFEESGDQYKNVELKGPAKVIFSGSVDI